MTASTWASDTAVATSGGPKAHSSEADLGAEKVASKALTLRARWPASKSTPVAGW